MTKLPVLLYDSECQLCSRFQKALSMLDRAKSINYTPIYDESIYIDFPHLSKDKCAEAIHFIDENKNVYVGGEAITELIKHFPQVKKFAWLVESESGKSAMNTFYNKLNDIREMKKNNCFTCGSRRR